MLKRLPGTGDEISNSIENFTAMNDDKTTKTASPRLVIQVGFAGSRSLYDPAEYPEVNADEFAEEVTSELVRVFQNLSRDLGVSSGTHFFCGISQIAIGGDHAFAEACQRQKFLHRVFLPQPLEEYLRAEGSRGADFSEPQRRRSRDLLEADHVIQTRIVSDAESRKDRFADVNYEIARVSDVVICLTRAGSAPKPGGTEELAGMAGRRGIPVIRLTVSIGSKGETVFERENQCLSQFKPPALPEAFKNLDLSGEFPDSSAEGELLSGRKLAEKLKRLGSEQADQLQFRFKAAARNIVGAHVLATVAAAVALKLGAGWFVAVLLIAELALLYGGLSKHSFIHKSNSIAHWAAFRLVAEVSRSIRYIGNVPVYLEHFFSLPFPVEFRPLLRTISVRHQIHTRNFDDSGWKACRDEYVFNRLTDPDPKVGQIAYQNDVYSKAKRWNWWAQKIFSVATIGALIATSMKLIATLHALAAATDGYQSASGFLGVFAVVLPVVAVGALSLAAAFDLEAREHTADEMSEFLGHQAGLLKYAESAREFSRLLIETESRVLGETVNWYARRSYLGVT